MAHSLTWLKAQFGKLGLSRHGMYAPDGIVLTIASYNYSYIRLTHFASTLCAAQIL